jgi:glycosyltransferase involved in cell wall biosynthesis
MAPLKTIKVAIDLTPMKPRGENGGAKIFILTLIQELAALSENKYQYLLITEAWNYEEISTLECSNVRCLRKSELITRASIFYYLSLAIKKVLLISVRVNYYLNQYLVRNKVSSLSDLEITRKILNSPLIRLLVKLSYSDSVLQKKYDVNLLFCPFSAPNFLEKGLPVVSTIYDLQHLDMPYFFTNSERIQRDLFLLDLSKRVNSVVAISEFSRQTFLKYFDFPDKKTFAIPISIHHRLTPLPSSTVEKTLENLNIDKRSYFFFPANFWPHKNHIRLIEAYSRYRSSQRENFLDLVFTGDIEKLESELKNIVYKSKYSSSIHFLGFLEQQELIAVWQGCEVLIFPSLYEGFGIPLLEAMWFGKPIICSNINSLVEVGGNAALYFNPYDSEEIAKVMNIIDCDNSIKCELVKLGRERLSIFSKSSMAKSYLKVFEDLLQQFSLVIR